MIATAAALAAATGLLVVGAMAATGKTADTFTRDLMALSRDAGADLPFYAGILSILTGWVWASGITLAIVGAILVPRRARWLVSLAVLLLLLALDDTFLLHERVGPDHGVPELVFYALYAVGGALLLGQAWSRRRDPDVLLFAFGGCALAASIGLDVLVGTRFELVPDAQLILEDGAKLFGALLWLSVPYEALTHLRRRPATLERLSPASTDRGAAPAPDVAPRRVSGHDLASRRAA